MCDFLSILMMCLFGDNDADEEQDNVVSYGSTTKKEQDLNFVPADKHCYLCRINFSTEKEHYDHIPVHMKQSPNLEKPKDSKQQFSVFF